MTGKSIEERVGVLESQMLFAQGDIRTLQAVNSSYAEKIDDRLRRMERMVYVHTTMLAGIAGIFWYFLDKLVKVLGGV